jgi:hypothetical protein
MIETLSMEANTHPVGKVKTGQTFGGSLIITCLLKERYHYAKMNAIHRMLSS